MNSGASSSMEFLLSKQIFRRMYSQYRYWMIFGDTSALLITMESKDKTYRELKEYMDDLQDRLRCISSIGRMTVSGLQNEQIAVYLDNEKLSQYGLTEQTLAVNLFSKGFITSGGRVQNPAYILPVHVRENLSNTVYDVQEQNCVYRSFRT